MNTMLWIEVSRIMILSKYRSRHQHHVYTTNHIILLTWTKEPD